MDMKRNYQGVLERIKQTTDAHPQVNSTDDGRELEFDVAKTDLWPRVFIRTEGSNVLGGLGTAQITVSFAILVMDRLNTKRDNVVSVMNETHSIAMDVMANLNKLELIRLEDNPGLTPLYDYQDTQAAGWIINLTTYLDQAFQCYPES